MAAGRAPTGLWTRPGYDYHLADAVVGHVDSTSGVSNAAVSLYNNANDGTTFGILGIEASKGGQAGLIYFRFGHGIKGTVVGTPNALRVGGPQPLGQFTTYTDSAAPDSNPDNFLQMLPNAVEGHLFAPSPFIWLPPGYSLIAVNDYTALFCVVLWWVQLPQVPAE